MVPEHIPGGKYHSLGEERKKEMLSAKKHNKLPEFSDSSINIDQVEKSN
jgi:hypothetical protein